MSEVDESERIEPVLILLTSELMFFDEPVSRLTVGDELMHSLMPVVGIDRHVLNRLERCDRSEDRSSQSFRITSLTESLITSQNLGQ